MPCMQKCAMTCAGSPFFGTEYGSEVRASRTDHDCGVFALLSPASNQQLMCICILEHRHLYVLASRKRYHSVLNLMEIHRLRLV